MNPRLLSAALFVACTGCASLGPERVDARESIRVSTPRVEREDAQVLAAEPRWVDGVLSARIARDELCLPVADQEVDIQSYKVRPARNLGWSVGGASALLVGGLAASAVWVSISDNPEYQNTPEDQLNGADVVGLVALVGVLGGLYGLYDSLRVYQASRPRAVGNLRTERRTVPNGDASDCGPRGMSTTALIVYGDDEIRRSFGEGDIVLEFATDPSLCPLEVVGSPVVITWQAEGEAGELWSGRLDDCAHTHQARALLAEIERDLSTNVLSSIEKYRRAKDLLPRIDESWPGHAEMVSKAADLEPKLRRRAADALDLALERVAASDSLASALEQGTEAIAAATLVEGSFADTWLRVHQAYASRVRDPEDLRLLLSADAQLKRCLAGSCSIDLTTQSAVDAYEPAVVLARRQLADSVRAVQELAKPRDPSVASERLEAERRVGAWCDVITWTTALDTPCADLTSAQEAAVRAIANKEREIEEQRVAATAKAWRGQLNTCRKVRAGIESFEGISAHECGSACQDALARLRQDLARLQAFEVEDPAWTDESQAAVREECQEAGCPKCP